MNIEELEQEEYESYLSMMKALEEDKPGMVDDEKELIIAEYMYLRML
jgi:hypothetical protein